jgi:hypothetical protein
MTSDPTLRDRALRRVLVATVDAGAGPQPSRWRLPVASIAVFALAGALAGVAVATFQPPADIVPGEEPIDFRPPPFLEDDVLVLGSPFVLSGREPGSIDLGPAPADANGLAIAISCLEAGSYDVSLDGEPAMGTTCAEEDGPPTGGGATVVAFGDDPPRELSVDFGSGSFAVWAAWVDQPADAEPSAAQSEALADGEVTREEYAAGFDRYVACMADLGFAVDRLDTGEDVISYVIPGNAGHSGAANRCYEAEFQELDMIWQVAHAE